MKTRISRFPALSLAVSVTRQELARAACLAATILLAPGSLDQAEASAGKIIVIGDEWAFSNDGLPNNPVFVTNVLNWFELENGIGKRVLILDGQSWNSGYNGTQGAFGSDFRSLLTGMGVTVTYLAYQDDLLPLAGYDAVFVDGFMVKATSLTNDLANFVRAGGAVYLAGGTGTFSPANAAAEAAYWQPFLTAATGSGDFGLVGGNGWFEESPPLQAAGPVGNGVTILKWYIGQGVQVGNNPNARAAIWDSARTLVATWSASLQVQWTTNNLPPGLIAWWQAEGNYLDSVGTNQGTPIGGATFTPGRAGQGFIFSGTNQGVIIPHAASLEVPPSGFTVEFWMKAGRDQPEASSSIVDNDHSAQDNTGWEVSCWRESGRLSCGIGDGLSFPLFTNLTDVLDNQFHHVAFAWDRTNWLIYVNGVLENSLYRPAVANNARPLRFGYHWPDGTATPMRHFKGALDDVRLYNRALSAAEIAYLFQGATPPVTQGLKLHFDAGDVNAGSNPAAGAMVTAWRDLSGLGLDATPLFGVAPVYRTNALNGRAGVDFSLSGSDALATSITNQLNFTNCTIFIVGNGANTGTHISISAANLMQELCVFDKGIQHHSSPFHYVYRNHQVAPAGFYVQAAVFGVKPGQLASLMNGVASTNEFVFGQQSPTLNDVADFTIGRPPGHPRLAQQRRLWRPAHCGRELQRRALRSAGL